LSKRREEVLVASGSGARTATGLVTARRKIVSALGGANLDLFYAEYVMPQENQQPLFAEGGVFDVLTEWKSQGTIRYVGATTHDRGIARQILQHNRVDVLMHRFNMAHRKAAGEVFPTALKRQIPVVAFTATRWRTLLKPHPDWPGTPPTAADCYRYCLAQPAIQIVLTAPQSVAELEENLEVLKSRTMSPSRRAHCEQFGDIVRGAGADRFETRWP
jgi:aryl-alcohol dehydrogenase-like predicted oxidoreductase